jgi:hypothetical protein
MLLSHRYNFLFVHIAKTGGTSVRNALRRRTWVDPYRFPQWIGSRISGWTGHRIGAKFPRHAKVIAAKEMLPDDFFDGLYKFAFVRNPWDLQVSSYHHVKRERPHLMAGIDDFESFLNMKFSSDRPYHYILDASVEPQWRSTINLQGECILDFIGRFENLMDDYRHICNAIDMTPAPDLPHKRRAGARRDYRSYYTQNTAEFVGQLFREDVEKFGYDFDSAGKHDDG